MILRAETVAYDNLISNRLMAATNELKRSGSLFLMKRLFIYQSRYLDLLGLMGLIAITLAITTFYISQEQYFYFWDYTHYSDRVSQWVAKLYESPFKALENFVDYLGDDYTQIPSIPLMPFALVFGNSRLVFILSLALVYVVSFCLTMGTIATQVIAANARSVFWLAAYLSILMPATWSSILRGYPDLGGASLMSLAILFYWKEPQLKTRNRMIQLALILAIAVWFRRPFAYSVRAFFATLLVEAILNYLVYRRQKPKAALNAFTASCIKLFKTGGWFLIFSPVLVFKVLFVDYRTLYASYELSVLEGLQYYVSEFGGLICTLALLGYGAGLWVQNTRYREHRFLLIWGGLSITQWIFLAKQNGAHYTIHFSPFIIVGLVLFAFSVRRILSTNSRLWFPLLFAGVGLTSFNLLSGLTSFGLRTYSFRSLFAVAKPPLYRTDYQEFAHLISFLRKITSGQPLDKKNIYVAASSQTLTSDAILAGDRQLYPKSQLTVLRTSNIDSRDVYPLNALMKAHFVVVAVPVQYHIKPDEQKVVRVVVDTFQQNQLFSRDFQPFSNEFTLENGVQVRVYQRIRATPLSTVIAMLQAMQVKVDRQPGREPYWLTLQSEEPINIEKDIVRTVQIRDIPLRSLEPSSFLYFGSLSPSIALNATLNTSRCPVSGEFSLRVSALNVQGQVLTTQIWSNSKGNEINVRFKDLPPQASYLRLDLQFLNPTSARQTDPDCSISVNNMVVSKVK